jgi:hypothetical protein
MDHGPDGAQKVRKPIRGVGEVQSDGLGLELAMPKGKPARLQLRPIVGPAAFVSTVHYMIWAAEQVMADLRAR